MANGFKTKGARTVIDRIEPFEPPTRLVTGDPPPNPPGQVVRANRRAKMSEARGKKKQKAATDVLNAPGFKPEKGAKGLKVKDVQKKVRVIA